ncbi:unnamed protein product [Ectocarpus sp. 6 AP-2014]
MLSSCFRRTGPTARAGFVRGLHLGAPNPGSVINDDAYNNVSPSVAAKIGKDLHRCSAHPLGIIKERIELYFQKNTQALGQPQFKVFDDLPPIVTVEQNFDELLIPPDHVSRQPSNTYYVDAQRVLRCHTSAHQTSLLRQGEDRFLVCGDVYRRDEVDSTHYPVFHQMEGVRILTEEEAPARWDVSQRKEIASKDLKRGLEGLATNLFGNVEMRWVDAYFPFTTPSAELEILFRGKWMEVLGCGVIHDEVMDNAGRTGEVGWAFGLGLERLAMVLFSIPDIRLFWSEDPRFSSQFEAKTLTTFQPYSKYPPCYKDVTFWLPEDNFHNNDLFEVVRDVAGDLVEEIRLLDDFIHPKTQRKSRCFRITYRSMDRSLTNEEVDRLQEIVRGYITSRLDAELR